MAAFALLDAFSYVHGYDFTTDTNNVMLTMDAEAKDVTTFGSGGWVALTGGLKKVVYDMKGYWQSATAQAVDPESFPDLGNVDRVFTVGTSNAQPTSPAALTAPERAYMFKAGKFHYEPFGTTIGEVAPFALNSMGSNGVGVVAGILTKAKGTVSATGQLGSIYDTLGLGIPAGISLYATFHVFVAATTITVQVQSDDNTGFTTPTTVATIGPITTAGGTWMTPVPGVVADRYFRMNVSAITGTHTVAAAMGIR